MGRYKSARDQRRDKENRKGVIQLGVAAVVLGALFAAYFVAVSGRRSLDPVTLCPASPDSITILLVDVTDPLNLAQRQDFINQLEQLRSTIPQYGKLAVFKVDPTSEQLLKPVIERCNPGTADDVSEVTGNKEGTAKRWREEFEQPLDRAFAGISEASSGAPRSPILESLQSVALTELANQEARGKDRTLVVASDLLQNTDRLSFYGGLPATNTLIDSDAFRTLRTDLKGVKVELWMLQRADAARSQPAALRDVWQAMIGAMGGDVERIYNVSG